MYVLICLIVCILHSTQLDREFKYVISDLCMIILCMFTSVNVSIYLFVNVYIDLYLNVLNVMHISMRKTYSQLLHVNYITGDMGSSRFGWSTADLEKLNEVTVLLAADGQCGHNTLR